MNQHQPGRAGAAPRPAPAPAPHPTGAVRRYAPRPAARLRLICFPHAGGGASSFRAWAALLPPTVELLVVQYPGREDRYHEPCAVDLHGFATATATELLRYVDRPYALFGHSMGAVIGYETAQRLRWHGRAEPVRLVASGRPSPDQELGGTLHRADDDALCAELARLGGTATEVLAEPDVRRAVLGYVRADYQMVETYRPRPVDPLACPLTVFIGDTDPECDERRAGTWERFTSGRFSVRVFPGDHFYLGPQRGQVVSALLGLLDPALVGAHATWPSTP
ncbi:alpha/beta fold hydrolase [Frankia sp. KB5]|uniref:thioesterase II family protein n=1 Tax=Frankia sp. KB5 TaxID=683318 RepID=UPI000A119A68|nr:alpha/beta fold hydrolase [Frankia sp. KB5]ORT53490.1 thioesterase [Frankia sp. KB5]